MMAKALKAEGIELTHIIGPKTAHAYERDAKEEINRRIDRIAGQRRNPVPDKVWFTTWTLRYNEMLWVTVDGLERHWERARVDAELQPAENSITASTKNVSRISFSFASGLYPLDLSGAPKVLLDGQKLEGAVPFSDRSWAGHFEKQGKKWAAVRAPEETSLRKRHALQGPIDDAFMDSFIMVRPTGKPFNEKAAAWAAEELGHATNQWRQQFRGEPRVKDDADVTPEEIASNNLVLWGDPASNQLLARLAG